MINIPTQFLPATWQDVINTLAPGTCSKAGVATDVCNFQPAILITKLLPNILGFAGIILFFISIGAGWGVLSSAGNEVSAQDKAKAQAALTYAVGGFLIVICAYFILQVVSTVTGINFSNPSI